MASAHPFGKGCPPDPTRVQVLALAEGPSAGVSHTYYTSQTSPWTRLLTLTSPMQSPVSPGRPAPVNWSPPASLAAEKAEACAITPSLPSPSDSVWGHRASLVWAFEYDLRLPRSFQLTGSKQFSCLEATDGIGREIDKELGFASSSPSCGQRLPYNPTIPSTPPALVGDWEAGHLSFCSLLLQMVPDDHFVAIKRAGSQRGTQSQSSHRRRSARGRLGSLRSAAASG